MRGELNPLEVVLDGGSCKYCFGNDLTKGEWEVNPETHEVFHTSCKEKTLTIASTYGQADQIKLTPYPTRVPLKELTPKQINKQVRRAMNAKAQGSSKMIMVSVGAGVPVVKKHKKVEPIITVSGERSQIKRGVVDTLHSMQGVQLAHLLYGDDK